MNTRILGAIAGAVVAAAMAGVAQASLAPMTQYNAIVFEDLHSSSNVEGRVLVGGNLSGSIDVAVSLGSVPASDVTLAVGGDLTANTNVQNGSVEVGGVITGNVNLNGGPGTTATAGVPLDLTAMRAAFESESDYLGTLAPNSTIALPGTQPANIVFNANPNPAGIAVFDIPDPDLVFSNNLAQQILLDTNGASVVVVNVRGQSVTYDQGNMGASFTTNGITESVLWNFPEADDLTVADDVVINRQIFGSVLAPRADLFMQGAGNGIHGSVVVKSLEMHNQLHFPLYANPLIPEPATLGLLTLGLVGLSRRR